MSRTLLALLLTQLLALVALGQSAAEFGRASGGAIDVMTKGPSQFSGTLSFTHSTGMFSGQRYEGSLGGTLVPDRLWFFGSASMAKVNAQPVDWSNVIASYSRPAQPFVATSPELTLPSSFLSLRSTSMLSDRMMLNVSVWQTKSR